jgi:hypothetical protein
MTQPQDQPTSRLTALSDLAFRMTTSPMHPESLWPSGRVSFFDTWIMAGGALRSAGPKWFTVWERDYLRMKRLNIIVLPAPWLHLSEEELIAVFFSKLRHLDPEVPETPWLSNALARANSRIRLALMRGR